MSVYEMLRLEHYVQEEFCLLLFEWKVNQEEGVTSYSCKDSLVSPVREYPYVLNLCLLAQGWGGWEA